MAALRQVIEVFADKRGLSVHHEGFGGAIAQRRNRLGAIPCPGFVYAAGPYLNVGDDFGALAKAGRTLTFVYRTCVGDVCKGDP